MAEDQAVCLAVRRRLTLLDPPDALARNTAVLERAAALAAARHTPPKLPAAPVPTREELLAIIGCLKE